MNEHPNSSRACEVRHVVFSLSTAPALSPQQLKKMARALATYTPRRPWLVVEHQEHGRPHLDVYL